MESTVVFRAAALVLSYPDEELIGNLDAIEEAVAATSVADLFHRSSFAWSSEFDLRY